MPASSLLKPALTTVRQPILEMGSRAFDIAIGAIDKKFTEDQNLTFKPELIVRQSA
jgi:DNA-binding LacI/PurR family transcriptional regulator